MLIDKHSVFTELQKEYNIGSGFLELYLENWFGTSSVHPEEFESVYENPTSSLWFFFGISANMRGRDVANTLKPFISKFAQKYLDVGCGYGGFLIGFSELGLDVFGIDIDPKLITYARANLRDHNLSEDKAELGNILDPTVITRLGKFDVITCNDVLEHVNNASQAMKNMVDMLTSRGTVLIQVPNKDYIDFVRKDGHYNLFGITLLEHEEAKEYHRFFYPEEYGMGEYFELDYYLRNFKSLQCNTCYIPPKIETKNLSQALKSILKSLQDLFMFWAQKAKPSRSIKLAITIKYIQYLVFLFFHGFLAFFSEENRKYFWSRYLTDFWMVVAIKEKGIKDFSP